MVWYILGIVIALIIQAIIAGKFASIAEEKGHYGTSYFWLCFLLGAIGYSLVAALPDYTLHNKIENLSKTNNDVITTALINAPASSNANTYPVARATITSRGTWLCRNCQAENSTNYGQCKKCGKFRT